MKTSVLSPVHFAWKAKVFRLASLKKRAWREGQFVIFFYLNNSRNNSWNWICAAPRGKQDNELRFGILPQTGIILPNWRVKFGVPPVACFPPESGGQVRTSTKVEYQRKPVPTETEGDTPFGIFGSWTPYFTSNKLLYFASNNFAKYLRFRPPEVTSTAVFGIYPLLGAMGLVLTRLSRSSNTLKEVHWGWSC